MEARGIRTDKGDFNRWVKATNALICKLKKRITALLDWLKEAYEELNKPQAPMRSLNADTRSCNCSGVVKLFCMR